MSRNRPKRGWHGPLGACLVSLLLLTGAVAQARTGPGGTALPGTEPTNTPGDSPFDRQGMWIWYVDKSEAGSLSGIVSRAKRSGVGTVYVKSGDGTNLWSQFSKALVRRLHAGGIDVCSWQFVYGDTPLSEAKVGAVSVKRGADCLVIDAEGQYEGKYASADRYIRALRARVGADYPVGLAGFPYVDYHPGYPYSVFLGPGGAQYNTPQMYWRAIETSVRAVFEHTYTYNTVYGDPIYPLGQTYGVPNRRELVSFRRFSASYGNRAPSWWSWQETTPLEWKALGSDIPGGVTGYKPITKTPTLRTGSKGDLVVWAQQHLVGAGRKNLPVTGIFGKMTRGAVKTFQADRGMTADGVIGGSTWRALLKFRPVRVNWAARAKRAHRHGMAGRIVPGGGLPLSASLPAKAYEINPGPKP